MMPYIYDNSVEGISPAMQQQYAQHYPTPTASSSFFDDLSQQLASASSALRRRHSRGSRYSSRTPGSMMRVLKPNSANNSPQSAAVVQARRRSQYTSPHHLPQQPQPDFHHLSVLQQRYDAVTSSSNRPARPLSWHPGSTYLLPAQMQMPLALNTPLQASMYACTPSAATPSTSAADFDVSFATLQPFSLSPAHCSSNQTSPSTTFSPYTNHLDSAAAAAAGQYYSPNPWPMSPAIHANGVMFERLPSPVECPALLAGQEQQQQQQQQHQQFVTPPQTTVFHHQQPEAVAMEFETLGAALDLSSASSVLAGWSASSPHNLSQTTAPPTPSDVNVNSGFVAAAVSEPTVQTQAPDEMEGEVLIGMGLYDPPEKEVVDPTLQSYRSSVAQILGAAYQCPEPTGKGLKLEDAWEPPENMDGDSDKNDEDDAECESDE